MHYAPGDRFNLAAAVASRFPTTGIADPAISDVLYCRRASRYFYVFRFEYTVGAMGPRRRRRAIVGFIEPRDAEHQGAVTLQVAAESGSEESRYRSLLGSCGVD